MKSEKLLFSKNFHRDQLNLIAEEIKKHLGSKTLVLWKGPVGAGKTTLISVLGQILGFTAASSPSFAIHHRYENQLKQTLDHVDLYRLTDEADLDSTGFWDLFQQEEAWIMVEWSDRIASHAWPLNWPTLQIELEKLEGDQRSIRILQV